jgi:hypothetical protein
VSAISQQLLRPLQPPPGNGGRIPAAQINEIRLELNDIVERRPEQSKRKV